MDVNASITPRLRMSRNSSTRSDNPAALLRALLSRLPAQTPSPTNSHALSVQGSTEQERESDFDTVSESNVAPSIAQESLKHIFSNALRDTGKKERAKNKVKRRSVSDDEVENTSPIHRRDVRPKSTSPPTTMEFLRERFSDSHSPSLDLRDRDSEMRNLKSIEGMWLNTPKSREGTEQGSPSDDASQSSGDTPRAADDGLSYVKTPARTEATYGFRSSAKTPKPPGGWMSAPAPAPSIFSVNGLDDGDDGLQRTEALSLKSPPSPRRQKSSMFPSDDEVENSSQSIDRHDIRLKSTSPPITMESLRKCYSDSEVTEQGSLSNDATQSNGDTPLAAGDGLSYVKTPARAEATYGFRPSAKTPKPPGRWMSTPGPAPSIFGVNGLDDGDDGLQRTESLSLKSPPSPRRQQLPKSPSDDEVENSSQPINRRNIRLKSTSPPITMKSLLEFFSDSEVTEQGSPSNDATQSNGDTPLAAGDGLSYVRTPARAEAPYGFRSSAKTPKPPGGWTSTSAPAPSIVSVNGFDDSDDNLQHTEELSSKSPPSPRRQKSPKSPSDDEVENTSQSIDRRDIRLKSTSPTITMESLRECYSDSEVTEQGNPSNGATQSNGDTPLAADGGLSYVKTLARAEATYGFRSSAKTPKPPGGWVSVKKSTMKVRFKPEVSSLDDGDDGFQRTEELSSKSAPSPRRQKSPKSFKIRMLDAFGREQEPDLSNQEPERVNSSPSALRVVDAMGHEIDEVEDAEAAPTPSRSTVSRGELLSRIRNGLGDLVVGIDDLDKDNQPLYIDHDRVHQLTTISSRARGLRETLCSQDDSSRSSLSSTKASWFPANPKVYIILIVLQLSLTWLVYRISINRAQDLWLNRYYDPFNPELHLYIFKSDASIHVLRSEGARTTVWSSLVGHIWDGWIYFTGNMQFRFWHSLDNRYDNARTPT